MSEKPICEMFLEMSRLAEADGVCPIDDLPGCWERKVDANWWVAVNCTKVERRSEPPGCMEVTLKPYHAAVWWNGWIAGLVTPYNGCIAANPDGANEDALIAALQAARGA